MNSGTSKWVFGVAALSIAGVWAAVTLFGVSVQGGETFPAYSTLRADPRGAKVLHDALSDLPGYRVGRSVLPAVRMRVPEQSAVVLLGAHSELGTLELARKWATGRGARVVIALAPRPVFAEAPNRATTKTEEEWRLRFEPLAQRSRRTAFKPLDTSWRTIRETEGRPTMVEKSFGARGSIVLLGDTVTLSNEGLYRGRDARLIADLLGGRREIIFEESHLGVVETGSVGQLLRAIAWGARRSCWLFWPHYFSGAHPPASCRRLLSKATPRRPKRMKAR